MNNRIYNKIIHRLGESACYYGGYGYWKPVNIGVSRNINRYSKQWKIYKARQNSIRYINHDNDNLPF